jgi:hypothetical protein
VEFVGTEPVERTLAGMLAAVERWELDSGWAQYPGVSVCQMLDKKLESCIKQTLQRRQTLGRRLLRGKSFRALCSLQRMQKPKSTETAGS